MEKNFFAIFAVALAFSFLAAGCINASTQPTPSPTPTAIATSAQPVQVEVSIRNFAFIQNALVLPVGSEVMWVNYDDAPHQVKGGGWQSPVLPKGGVWSKKFSEKGEFAYHCALHPSMTGNLIVN